MKVTSSTTPISLHIKNLPQIFLFQYFNFQLVILKPFSPMIWTMTRRKLGWILLLSSFWPEPCWRDFLSEPISAQSWTSTEPTCSLVKGKNTAISELLFATTAMFMHFSKTAFTKVSVSSEKRVAKKTIKRAWMKTSPAITFFKAQVQHSRQTWIRFRVFFSTNKNSKVWSLSISVSE